MFEPQDIECPDCLGEGEVEHPHLQGPYGGSHAINPPEPVMVECEACNGTGWRPMTEDEENDAAEAAYEAMRQPPVSLQEACEDAWKLKRSLRR